MQTAHGFGIGQGRGLERTDTQHDVDLVPSSLRLHAGLERDIWFVGMGQRFDIWSKESYSRVNAQDEKNFPIESEALAALGI